MLGFFIKKAFFDGWDNLFTLIALNLGFILILAAGVFLPPLLGTLGFLPPRLLLLAIVLLAALWYAASVFALRKVADFSSLSLADFRQALRDSLLPGLGFGAMVLAILIVLGLGLPFYLGRGGLFGAFAAGLLLWSAAAALLALQWFLPLSARLGGGFRKNLRKSLVLFLDNAPFTILLLAYNLLGLVLSFFLAFLAPGLAGAALAMDDALRLRLLKYDWLEANPGSDRRKVPWGELLAEDAELVGKRTLKGMIFPWKE